MYHIDTHVRVRYAETDQMGYMYYGRYAEYHEVGRVELIRSLGMSYRDLEENHGIWLPVVDLEFQFRKPAFYDELLRVHTELRTLPDRFISFHTDIYNEAGELCQTGVVRLCFFSAVTKKMTRAPEILLDRLRANFPG